MSKGPAAAQPKCSKPSSKPATASSPPSAQARPPLSRRDTLRKASRHDRTLRLGGGAGPASALLGGWPKCYQVRRWPREEGFASAELAARVRAYLADNPAETWDGAVKANVDGSLSPG